MNKKIITLQSDFKDCGACTLHSIIKYYNGFIPLNKIKEDTYTTKDGTSMYHLKEALISYNFFCKGLKIKLSELKSINLPCIANVVIDSKYSHFIVIYKMLKDKLLIMDPAFGIKKITLEEFNNIFTGYLLTAHPNGKIIKLEEKNELLNNLKKVLKNNKNIIIKILFISVFFIILSLIYSLFYKIMNNYINSFKLIAITFILIILLKSILDYIRIILINKLNKNIDKSLMNHYIKHIFNLPLSFIKNKNSGEILTRVYEIYNIKEIINEILNNILLPLFLGLFASILLIRINYLLFLLLLLVLIIYIIFGFAFNKKIYYKIKNNISLETNFNNELTENINGLFSIKNLNLNEVFLDKLNNNYNNYLIENYSLYKYLNNINFIKNIIIDLGLFLINIFGYYFIINNRFSIIDLITFNMIISYFYTPIKNYIDLLPKLNYIKASINKINEFYQVIEEKINKTATINKFNLELKNISYSYNKYNNVIENITFNINEKEKVLLKGESGKGKSTVCKLLFRLMDDYNGNISLGGRNILDYSLSDIRNNITYLSQNESLFSDTIKNNIICNRNINEKELNQIIKLCEIDKIIDKHSYGIYSMINGSNEQLSGGEKQRIILARCLLNKSKIIILDEALSEVETSMEKRIISKIIKEYNSNTIICISHRDLNSIFKKKIFL